MNNGENLEEQFKQYDKNSSKIVLYFKLERYFSDYHEWRNISLDAYSELFSSIINKEYFCGYEIFNKSDSLYEIKKKISKKSGFPIETFVGFGYFFGEKYDPNKKLWTIIENYDVNDGTEIFNSHYNSIKVTDRYVYLYIDPSKSKIFESINENQIKNDKKQDDLERNIRDLQKNESELNISIKNLKSENEKNRNKINDLTKENKVLKDRQENEEKIKKVKEENKNKFKTEFEKDKQNIKNNKINESKSKINHIIINEFAKEFETKTGKKGNLTISLINYIFGFTKEFMKFNENFIKSFKINSNKIIKEYDISKNNISIEHINFIVIGQAGVGKSSFINESLLIENQKAEEGIGESVTKSSKLYTSDKLKMIRMWDTPGIDFKVSQNNILKEIERLVNKGLKEGPDHYINIILYCTKGDRFQQEDGELIYNIMQLYPADNLPVVITQLQAYCEEDANKMKIEIKKILSKYFNESIVNKIEIKDLVSRDKQMDKYSIIRARGIPDLLRSSLESIGRAITSATFKKFSEDIENLCKEYVEKKIKYISKIFKDEDELLEVAKYLSNEEEGNLDNNTNKNYKKHLSLNNNYKNKKSNNYFSDNFVQILSSKIMKIYYNLNNISFYSKEKPAVEFFIEERLKIIKSILEQMANKIFNNIWKENFNDYYNDLLVQSSERNKQFKTNVGIYDAKDIKNDYINSLSEFFNNEFSKIFLCIIINLFRDNLKDILIENYQQYLKENEKVINEKAEIALKNVIDKLRVKLLNELNIYFSEKTISPIQTQSYDSSEQSNQSNLKDELFFPRYIPKDQ